MLPAFPFLCAQVTAITVETVEVHDGMVGNSDLTGMTTYRLYAQLTDSADFVGAVYGSAEEPIDISTTTSFFQHPAGGSFARPQRLFLSILPDLNYDSWLTIGLDLAPSGANERASPAWASSRNRLLSRRVKILC